MTVFIKKLTLLSLLLFTFLFTYGINEIDSLLSELDKTMATRAQYDQQKESRLQELKAFLREPGISFGQKYLLQNKLVIEYEPYKFDSLVHYVDVNIRLAEDLKNDEFLNQTRLHLSRILASSGRYKESVDVLEKLDKSKLSEDLVTEYFTCYEMVYTELSFYSRIKEHVNRYANLYKAYNDSLLMYQDSNSELYLSIVEKQLRDVRKLEECRKINSTRLAMTNLGDRTYSIVTFQRSLSYGIEGNTKLEKKYLILSAISDIKASVKDNASLTSLAMILFREGDIKRANRYINFSFEDADFFNSKLRLVEISNILPVINMAFQIKSEQQKSRLRTYLIVISILSLVLALTLLYISKQMKKLAQARNELQSINVQLKSLNSDLQNANNKLVDLNGELSETNHVKEQYIGSFLSICSNYIDKLENYRKVVSKHVSSKKYSDLFELTRPGKLLEVELKEFYANFDYTFLHIYPDFVKELNSLLLEEERIVLKQDEVLNTELRIFALIRLGITDSSKIAKLLRYSVNTIYNYRVKIKNKSAVAREDFETLIGKIGSFSK